MIKGSLFLISSSGSVSKKKMCVFLLFLIGKKKVTFLNWEKKDMELGHKVAIFFIENSAPRERQKIPWSGLGLYKAPRSRCIIKNDFLYTSTNTYVVGTQKNCLIETVLFST